MSALTAVLAGGRAAGRVSTPLRRVLTVPDPGAAGASPAPAQARRQVRGRRRRRAGSGRRPEAATRRTAPTIAALSVHRAGLGRTARRPARAGAVEHAGAQRRVGGDAAADDDRLDAGALARRGAAWPRARRRPRPGTTRRRRRPRTSGCLRTQCTTAVFSPENEKSSPSSSIGRGNAIARRIALGGEPVDRRPAGIAEAEEPRDLVEGLAGGVVDGLTEHAVTCRGPPSRRAACDRPTRSA